MQSETKAVICGQKSRPLLTAKQLLKWQEFIGDECEYFVVNKAFRQNNKKGHEMLLCHDMQGGYLKDSFNEGHTDPNTYRFYYWSLVDIFVYFSHHLVTIPPICWINAAHRNGASCFGTFIVEDWSKIQAEGESKPVSGKDILLEILQDSDSVKRYAERLVDIAKHFNFDGWLVNIEVNVPKDKVQLLFEFITILTVKMHQMLDESAGKLNASNENKEAAVIWYDSVAISGRIEYQNELTEKNYEFFSTTDGIFLNYWWQPESLKRSVDILNDHFEEKQKRFRIYAGIDVHGRNTFGGGKWDCNHALRAIQEQKVSTALFAPGWTFENFCNIPEFCFENYEHQFWAQLFPFLINSERKIRNLPIETTFCHGIGNAGKFVSGRATNSGKSWFNLSEMQLQPSFCLNVRHSIEESFQGGTCLKLDPKIANHFYLFRTEINLPPKKLYQSTIAYRYPESVMKCLQLNDAFLEDCEQIIFINGDFQTEYFENGWKKERIQFEIKGDDFILNTLSVKLRSNDEIPCFLGFFELKSLAGV